MELDGVARGILAELQGDLPVVKRPFKEIVDSALRADAGSRPRPFTVIFGRKTRSVT